MGFGRKLRRRYGGGGRTPSLASLKRAYHQVQDKLTAAFARADSRGYTGNVRSKGGVFDDPHVRQLMIERDRLLAAIGRAERRGR